jgi:hypothetical protein
MDSGVPREFADGASTVHGLVLSCPASKNGEVPNELRRNLSIAFTLGATQLMIIITEMRSVSVSDKFFFYIETEDSYNGVKLYSSTVHKQSWISRAK